MSSRAALVAVISCLVGCDLAGPAPGVRRACGQPGGQTLGCQPAPVDDPASACWRLVECGSIPVANPDDDPGCCFDWATCVDYVEELADERYDFALACIGSAPCAELGFPGSPDRPSRSEEELPACLQHGDR